MNLRLRKRMLEFPLFGSVIEVEPKLLMRQRQGGVQHLAAGGSPEFLRRQSEPFSDLGFDFRRQVVVAKDIPAVAFVVRSTYQLAKFATEQFLHAVSLLEATVVDAVLSVLVRDAFGKKPVGRLQRKNLRAFSPMLRLRGSEALPYSTKRDRLLELDANDGIDS